MQLSDMDIALNEKYRKERQQEIRELMMAYKRLNDAQGGGEAGGGGGGDDFGGGADDFGGGDFGGEEDFGGDEGGELEF